MNSEAKQKPQIFIDHPWLEDAAERIFTHAVDWNEGRKKWDMETVGQIILQEMAKSI